jgi:hypothetical protein
MLSAGGMHYPQGFGRMSTANMVTHHDHNQAPMSGLDALAQGSQYALQQLHDSHLNPAPQDHDAFSQNQSAQDQSASNKGSSNGAPVRRRISRACDQCNQLRTKCDGKTPCAHCVGMLTRPTRPCPAETTAGLTRHDIQNLALRANTTANARSEARLRAKTLLPSLRIPAPLLQTMAATTVPSRATRTRHPRKTPPKSPRTRSSDGGRASTTSLHRPRDVPR